MASVAAKPRLRLCCVLPPANVASSARQLAAEFCAQQVGPWLSDAAPHLLWYVSSGGVDELHAEVLLLFTADCGGCELDVPRLLDMLTSSSVQRLVRLHLGDEIPELQPQHGLHSLLSPLCVGARPDGWASARGTARLMQLLLGRDEAAAVAVRPVDSLVLQLAALPSGGTLSAAHQNEWPAGDSQLAATEDGGLRGLLDTAWSCVAQRRPCHLVNTGAPSSPPPPSPEDSCVVVDLCQDLAVRVAALEAGLAAAEIAVASAATDEELAINALQQESAHLRCEVQRLRTEKAQIVAQVPVGLPGSAFRAAARQRRGSSSASSSAGASPGDHSPGGGSLLAACRAATGGRPISAGARFSSAALAVAAGAALCPVCVTEMQPGAMAQHFVECARERRRRQELRPQPLTLGAAADAVLT